MTKDLIYQLKDFEIFVEKLEDLVNQVREDPEVKDGTYKFEHFDIRTGGLPYKDIYDNTELLLPKRLEDYLY